jgi:hypothetical protein
VKMNMVRFRGAVIAAFVGANAVGTLGLLGIRIFKDSHIAPAALYGAAAVALACWLSMQSYRSHLSATASEREARFGPYNDR